MQYYIILPSKYILILMNSNLLYLDVRILGIAKNATKYTREQNYVKRYRKLQNSAMQYKKRKKFKGISKITNIGYNY